MVCATSSRFACGAGLIAVLLFTPEGRAQTAPPPENASEPSPLLSLAREDAFRSTPPPGTELMRPSAMAAQDMPEAIEESEQVIEQEQAAIDKAFSIGLSYTLVSDYIFRGINFSEFPGEGREKLNHQVITALSVDLEKLGLGPIGSIHFDTFFEWYADQEKITGDGANIQEIDYLVYWSYDCEPLATTFSIGWTEYVFPNFPGPGDRTNEWWFSLAHNDAWMWKWLFPDNEEGVLNPTFLFAHDFELAKGVWMELAVSHPFTFDAVPHFAITPGLKLGIDAGYLGPLTGLDDHDTRLAFLEYNLNFSYALSDALNLPPEIGAISLNTFLAFSDAFAEGGSAEVVQDEFYGGVGVSWDW